MTMIPRNTNHAGEAEPTTPALSSFVPTLAELEGQAYDPATINEELADSPLFVRLAAAMLQARYSPSQRAALATTIRNAADGMIGYELHAIGQMLYGVTGGRAPYVYDDATESCTCPLWQDSLRVCKHSILGAKRLADARRLLGTAKAKAAPRSLAFQPANPWGRGDDPLDADGLDRSRTMTWKTCQNPLCPTAFAAEARAAQGETR